MRCMFHAVSAIFFPLKLVRRIFLVLHGRIVFILALSALEQEYLAHRPTPTLR